MILKIWVVKLSGSTANMILTGLLFHIIEKIALFGDLQQDLAHLLKKQAVKTALEHN